MNRDLADGIVRFLSSCQGSDREIEVLGSFREGEWNRALSWLHDSGLALYFLQKIRDTGALVATPKSVLTNLNNALQANRERNEYLSTRFQLINHAFTSGGVKYAVLKGFSLVPDFCLDISFRSLNDLDYLVSPESLATARAVIERLGYVLYSANECELKFLPAPPYIHDQYSARGVHEVELHLSVWDNKLHCIQLLEPKFDVERTITHSWRGACFPALPIEDVIVLQAIHTFHHVLTYWIRLSCFYELAVFLGRYRNDEGLWRRVDESVAHDKNLREVLSFTMQFSFLLFGEPLPSIVAAWAREMRAPVLTWMDQYARAWALGRNHPGALELFSPAKLVLFLHREYLDQKKNFICKRLLPTTRLTRIVGSLAGMQPMSRDLDWGHELVIRRSLFHLSSGLRYLWEVPRWRQLNRAQIGVARNRVRDR